jgi:hypothetical protein
LTPMRLARRAARLAARLVIPPAAVTAAALARVSSLAERLTRSRLVARAATLKSGRLHAMTARAGNVLAA